MKRWRGGLLGCCVMMVAASQCWGWDESGHQQIADLAWARLRPQTRRALAEILAAGDPLFRPPVVATTNPVYWTRQREAFRRAAVFPDQLKYSSTSFNTERDFWNRHFDPINDPLIPDSQKQRCSSWHYINIPLFWEATRPGIPRSNGVAALELAVAEMRRLRSQEPGSRRMQAWWLAWIIHLTGDLHQPLHCAASFRDIPTGDAGGNKFRLRSGSLHSLWDGGISDARSGALDPPSDYTFTTTRWLRVDQFLPLPEEARNLKVESWVGYGSRLAEQDVYPGIHVGGDETAAYRSRRLDRSKRQAILAGFRLAELLNQLLKPDS